MERKHPKPDHSTMKAVFTGTMKIPCFELDENAIYVRLIQASERYKKYRARKRLRL